MSHELPTRFPPLLSRSTVNSDPFIECGQLAPLGGEWVVCIREKGHPIFTNYAHSNGYEEWCFDSAENEGENL